MIIHRFLTWIEAAPAAERAEAANALVRAFLQSELTREDHEVADAALTLLLDDPSPEVRMALAEVLAHAEDPPHHLVMSLADDREDIAALVLEHSRIFMDGELIDYLDRGLDSLQIAIASRVQISATLSDAICHIGCAEACQVMLTRPNVTYTTDGLLGLARRLGHQAVIRTELLKIKTLPAAAREILLRHHASALFELTQERGWLSSSVATRVTDEAVGKAMSQLAARTDGPEIGGFIEHLVAEEKLTPAFMLRCLCGGNLDLFEQTMASLVQIDTKRMSGILRSGNLAAFSAAYQRSSLPSEAFDVFAAALSVTCQRENSDMFEDVSQLPRRIMEEIMRRCAGRVRSDAVDDSIKLLRRLAADAARDSARQFALEVAKAA